jgi:hypothetical protein
VDRLPTARGLLYSLGARPLGSPRCLPTSAPLVAQDTGRPVQLGRPRVPVRSHKPLSAPGRQDVNLRSRSETHRPASTHSSSAIAAEELVVRCDEPPVLTVQRRGQSVV